MPVVMSYQDIGALAALSHEAGRSQFRARDQQNATALVMNRQQQDTERMRLQTMAEQAEADRRLQANLSGQARQDDLRQFDQSLGYRYDALAQDQGQFDQRLAASAYSDQLRAQTQLAGDLMDVQGRQQRDEQLHDYRMKEIEARGQYSNQARAADGGMITAEGVPDKTFAEREAQRHGQLIPYGAGNAVSGGDASRRREEAAEQAMSFSMMPTSQLRQYVENRPSDKWAPYIRKVLQDRAGRSGGRQDIGGMPEGNRPTQAPAQAPGSLRGGSGYGLDTLDDAELMELANNPELMQRYFSGQ